MERIEHREGNWKFPFVEYRPSECSGKKLPMIIQLHGAGERGEGGDDLGLVDVHGFSKMMADAEYPCIFIMPQCPKDSFWAANVESIAAFVKELTREFDVDPDRVYLTGLSMGGYGTWFTAMAHPDLFAAIAPVCGGGMAWNAGVLKMPVWAFHGVCDDTVSVTQSDEMVAKLTSLGHDVKYSRIENVGHNVWENAYNEELINWLLDKRRR